uniref:Uncharacterized protein LOC100181657 n=1 Tax=Phallusia mammillata TaxID=59560 RepID=A0A6F9DI12_9ASCI|nr:uncharacterized protein LOC100181657 [Phallusia mammillata]
MNMIMWCIIYWNVLSSICLAYNCSLKLQKDEYYCTNDAEQANCLEYLAHQQHLESNTKANGISSSSWFILCYFAVSSEFATSQCRIQLPAGPVKCTTDNSTPSSIKRNCTTVLMYFSKNAIFEVKNDVDKTVYSGEKCGHLFERFKKQTPCSESPALHVADRAIAGNYPFSNWTKIWIPEKMISCGSVVVVSIVIFLLLSGLVGCTILGRKRMKFVPPKPGEDKLELQLENKNFCNVDLVNASCHINAALEYRATQTNYLPLWVEMCFFQVPQWFDTNVADFQCNIELDAGPVRCKLKPQAPHLSSLSSFESNCTIVLLWQDKVQFPTAHIKDIVFDKCAQKFQTFWSSTDVIYMADRYLASVDIPFSNSSMWMRIENTHPSAWSGVTIALLVVGCIGIVLGLLFCTHRVKKQLKYFKRANDIDESDSVIKHLDKVISSPDEFGVHNISEPLDEVE